MSLNFHQAMAWLHTWMGLVLGFVLMVCFFFGALSVFDREIDRWAIPQTRFAPQPMPSFEQILLPAFRQVQPDADEYAASMPLLHDPARGPMTPRLALPADEYWAYTTHRDPVLRMGVGFRVPLPRDPAGHNHIHGEVTLDPRSGDLMDNDQLKIGSDWFYPMHYSLNWAWHNLGYWLVGLAGFAMLAALVSGVVLHRKLFREIFTFRPWKHSQRRILDLHNLSGVAALPFHFFFAFTGVLIFAGSLYFPLSATLLQPLHDRHEAQEAQRTGLPHQRAGVPAALAPVDAMVLEAKRRWAARDMAGEVGFLTVTHVGDANAYVSIFRAGSDRVALVGEGIHFQASTGRVLREDPPDSPVSGINEFLTGLHLQHFEHWPLRWLYVLGGLLGSVCIATGFLFFVGKRRQQHALAGGQGSRLVEALAVTLVTGMLIATTAMLVANRALPPELAGKGDWEKAAFWAAWGLALVHAFLRGTPLRLGRDNPAWREQCLAVTSLALAAVLLNWVSTGDHLLRTLITDPYLAVAGVDLSLLALAGLAGLAARTLARGPRPAGGNAREDHEPVAADLPVSLTHEVADHG